MRLTRQIAGWLTLIALLAWGVQQSLGAPLRAPVQMTVTPLMAGHAKYGEWLPLRVTLSNSGADLETEVRVEVPTNAGTAVYAAAVPLPSGARKEVTLYVPPATFSRSLDVRLISGQEELLRESVKVQLHPQSETLIGVISSRADALSLLSGMQLSTRDKTSILPLRLEDLPERYEALRSLDVLVLSDVDTTRLTPAQSDALTAWVEQGGHLVLGGGSAAERVFAGIPEALRPVTLQAPRDLENLSVLEKLTGYELRVGGPFVATFPDEVLGAKIIHADGQTYVTQLTLGKGWVMYLALDPTASPFDAWAGTPAFWRLLLEADLRYPPYAPVDIPLSAFEAEQMGYALQNLPVLDPPSMKTLALVLGLYILLIGPLNYLVLRRLRKLDWAWLTIPLFTVAFAAGAFYVGYLTRGNDVVINRISILNLTPGSTRNPARNYVGIVSPSATTYEVRVSGSPLLSPITAVYGGTWGVKDMPLPAVPGGPESQTGGTLGFEVLQGDPALVRNLSINQWAMQSFKAETLYQTETPPFEVEVETAGVTRVRGTIRNHTDYDLRQPVLVNGSSFTILETIPAHGEKVFDTTWRTDTSGNQFPWSLYNAIFNWSSNDQAVARDNQLRQSILDAYFGTSWGQPQLPSGLLLLGWSDMPVLDVAIPRLRLAPLQTTLIAYSMPLPVQAGEITLPFGSVIGRFVSSEGDGGECGPGRIYLTRGKVVVDYQLPTQVRGLNMASLQVLGRPDPGITGLPAVALYDWAKQEWVPLEPLQDYVAAEVPDPQRFLSPVSSVIRLQASFEDWGGKGCYEFQVGLTGQMP